MNTFLTGSSEMARVWCNGGDHPVGGCAKIGKGRCIVFVPNDLPPQWHEIIMRHEIAHCNGWRHGER
jgi:hypothetical protein